MPLEIAAFNIESALTAAIAGADRIEFCANAHLGGTTPSLSDFKLLKQSLRRLGGAAGLIPVYVMIRPRGGGFVYTKDEVGRMEEEMRGFMGLGVEVGRPDGFVFGILGREGGIDGEGCGALLALAGTGGRCCTFHRAFDDVPVGKRGEAVEEILGLGFKGILTSGGAADAGGGREVLKELVGRVRGRGCEIIVGGGVRSGNLEGLREGVGARWWHSSADVEGRGEADGQEVKRLVEMVGSRD
ncbi:hypothetical protein EG328_011799 [Venturia inaequalis]|uniref:Copper homeostasis protein cutC homolog n=1 Tax=Venturia inaequalis TaxID=5025 RepID=A0A8H3Z118_VENIN|nr:hypothetical protein EG328_011799 [Venturia inaequalis]RDI88911.1 hypothetical protein Vi05172_g1546 [Venturia inaequalis]